MIGHLHAKGGFAQIRVSSGKLLGAAEYNSMHVLNELTRHVEEKFGFGLIGLSLHFHTSLGYVDVHISNQKPMEVWLETMEHEHQGREFAGQLPRA